MNCHYCNDSTGMCDMCKPRGQQITELEELKPCPFCGGEAELWRASADNRRSAWIACMGKCAVLITKEHTTDAEAIAAWNRRAEG